MRPGINLGCVYRIKGATARNAHIRRRAIERQHGRHEGLRNSTALLVERTDNPEVPREWVNEGWFLARHEPADRIEEGKGG